MRIRKNRRLSILLLSLLLLGLSGATLQAQLQIEGEGQDLFIKNATVLTITNGIIENGVVHVQNGKIKAVGKNITVPDNVRVIDAKGHYLMPGIIDSHSHMALEGGINESSRSITPEVNIHEVIKPDDISLQRALAGGVTAIMTLHGSANPIGGRNAVIKLKFGQPAEKLLIPNAMSGIKFALGENVKRSNMTIPGVPKRFPTSRMGTIYIIRESFNEAKEYMKSWETYAKKKKGKLKKDQWEKKYGLVPPKRDLKLETLADILKGKLTIICHGYRSEEMVALMKLGDEMGFKVHSFEHCLEGFKIADEMAAHGAIASIFADSWAYKMEAFDAIPYNAAILINKGVIVTINSDSGERVRRLYQDAAKLIKYDVSEEEALKTITINPAIMLGIDKRVGSIEKGKDADLTIFNGHPFSVYSKCVMTMIEGDIYFDLGKTEQAAKMVAAASAKDNDN